LYRPGSKIDNKRVDALVTEHVEKTLKRSSNYITNSLIKAYENARQAKLPDTDRKASFDTLLALDRKLEAAGHHPLTPWWSEQLKHWYEHPTAYTLIARVGRGGAKSHTSVKVSINEVLANDWHVPPGEVHFWAYVSTTKDEATQRLRLIESFLTALGIQYNRAGDEIILTEAPIGWRVFAAQIGAASGFRCIGYSADELCKWRTGTQHVNPADEVIASLQAMSVTHPDARKLLISSPVGLTDYHATRFALGDTDEQVAVQAASWEANSATTEAQCRRLEPDPRIFAREYAAIPQAAALAAFDFEAVERAFAAAAQAMGAPFTAAGIIDASSGKKDAWTWGVANWRDVNGRRKLVFEKVAGFEGRFWSQKAGEKIVDEIAAELKSRKTFTVHGDQRESLMLASAFGRMGIKFVEHPWSAPAKERAVSTVRRWLADDRLVLPEHAKLTAELLQFEEHTTSSGALTFGARGTGHDDFVSLLLTAALADEGKHLAGSPTGRMGIVEALRILARKEAERKAARA
jgi:hypothetical protein